MSASDETNNGPHPPASSRPSNASAGTHTPQPIEKTQLHSPSKTGVNALMLGPCFRRDDSVDGAIQCICIDPAHVSRVWPLVAHLIRAAMRKGRISEFADVEEAVLAGTQLLWVAADRQAIWAAAVTQLSRANGETFCTIVACGGRERARWLPLKAELEKFAKAEGCAAIRIHGRRGWAREFPDYRLTRILLEKDLA
jgi:hypothetical protein